MNDKVKKNSETFLMRAWEQLLLALKNQLVITQLQYEKLAW